MFYPMLNDGIVVCVNNLANIPTLKTPSANNLSTSFLFRY